MSWKQSLFIDNFINYNPNKFDSLIRKGYLAYSPENNLFRLRRIEKTNTILDLQFEQEKVTYSFFKDILYISSGNKLYRTDFELNKLENIYTTSESTIGMLNEYVALARTSSRRPKINRDQLIKVSNGEMIYEWDDRSMPVEIFRDSFIILENNFELVIKGINIVNKKELWNIPLYGFSIPRFYQSISKDLFLIMQSFDTNHPVDKRYELWCINKQTGEIIYKSKQDHLSRYLYSEESQMLYGIQGQRYLRVDPISGKILDDIIISELVEEIDSMWAILGRQSLSGNNIFFCISRKSQIGRFNINTKELEEIIEVKVDESKVDMRSLLRTPLVYNDTLYVIDNSSILHILSKES